MWTNSTFNSIITHFVCICPTPSSLWFCGCHWFISVVFVFSLTVLYKLGRIHCSTFSMSMTSWGWLYGLVFFLIVEAHTEPIVAFISVGLTLIDSCMVDNHTTFPYFHTQVCFIRYFLWLCLTNFWPQPY